MFKLSLPLFLLTGWISCASAAEETLNSPNGAVTIAVSDQNGAHFRVAYSGVELIHSSPLGLAFQDGTTWGPHAVLADTSRRQQDTTWANPLGKSSQVRDHFNELTLSLTDGPARFQLIVRAYDEGVAFRYILPKGLTQPLVITGDLATYIFAGDYPCWAGTPSICAESTYPRATLGTLPAQKNVAPVLVQAPGCYAAITEADLRDWAGSFYSGVSAATPGATPDSVHVVLEERKDHHGSVLASAAAQSPWRVLMLGRTPGDLFTSHLIENLATPSQLPDSSWIKPGITAWDPWWTGLDPLDPKASLDRPDARTPADKLYIDFASEMGWPYQLIDGGWYKEHDVTQANRSIDIPKLLHYAQSKGVREWLWMHSEDLAQTGLERGLDHAANWGIAGLKIDFINSCSQETIQWCEKVLALAAQRHLMVNFHGMYVPTGLSRTWPNLITQEGVMGNEYNKFGFTCTPTHTLSLAFTRDLLGPMDFTPGGFINVTPAQFKNTAPAEVMGTRARQLAMTVVYFNPLLCLCDSPPNYRHQPGLEFFRGLPTVWDETRVLQSEIGQSIVVARRSKQNWYLSAMNADQPTQIALPLSFLSPGAWHLHSFSDIPASTTQPEKLSEQHQSVSSEQNLKLSLAPVGGYAAVLTPAK